MVEHRHRQPIDPTGHAEARKRGQNLVQPEVSQPDDGRAGHALDFVVAHHLNAHLADRVQIVVKRPRRLRGGVDRQTLAYVVHRGPVAGAAAHGDAAQRQRRAALRDRADRVGDRRRRRRHHQLKAVLKLAFGIEQQDVLGAGPHVHGQDAHGVASG